MTVFIGRELPSTIFDQISVQKDLANTSARKIYVTDEDYVWRIYFYYEGAEVSKMLDLSYDEALEVIQKIDPSATSVRVQEITVINDETGEEEIVQEASGMVTYYDVSDESDVEFTLPTDLIEETTSFIKEAGSLIPLAGLGLLALFL